MGYKTAISDFVVLKRLEILDFVNLFYFYFKSPQISKFSTEYMY